VKTNELIRYSNFHHYKWYPFDSPSHSRSLTTAPCFSRSYKHHGRPRQTAILSSSFPNQDYWGKQLELMVAVWALVPVILHRPPLEMTVVLAIRHVIFHQASLETVVVSALVHAN